MFVVNLINVSSQKASHSLFRRSLEAIIHFKLFSMTSNTKILPFSVLSLLSVLRLGIHIYRLSQFTLKLVMTGLGFRIMIVINKGPECLFHFVFNLIIDQTIEECEYCLKLLYFIYNWLSFI